MNGFQRISDDVSGSNIHILQKSPSEWNKYAKLAESYFYHSFATLSASYAMFTVFEDVWISRRIWDFMGTHFFNLDRYIVSSIKKNWEFWNQFSWQFRV